MLYRRVELDVELFAELVEFSGREVASVVGEDAVRDTKAAGDALEELDGCGGRLVGDGDGLYPLGELIDRDKEECVPAR